MAPINPTDNVILTLSDLRRLGRQGGATLILDDGRQAIVKAKFALIVHKKWQEGHLVEEKEVVSFHTIYPAIMLVKRKHFVIARRVRRKKQQSRTLTGQGYHRPSTSKNKRSTQREESSTRNLTIKRSFSQ